MPVRLASLLIALVASGCNGPFLVLPGGGLDGDTEPVPASWAFAGDYGTIQLEPRPEDPYSVNIAVTAIDGRLYINAGDTETQWVKNMTANPLVRVRLKGTLYDMRVARVTDSAEISKFAEAWTNQSFFRRDPDDLDEVWLYRVVSR